MNDDDLDGQTPQECRLAAERIRRERRASILAAWVAAVESAEAADPTTADAGF